MEVVTGLTCQLRVEICNNLFGELYALEKSEEQNDDLGITHMQTDPEIYAKK